MSIILAIGSHFDDVEIGLGGTILKHRDAGDRIIIAVTKCDDNLAGDVLARKLEQMESLAILKADLRTFEYLYSVEEIVAELDKIKPDVLYYPFEADTHQDHVATAQIGLSVARHIGMTVLRYLTPTSHSYYPNWLSVVDWEAKKRLLNVFQSQITRNPKLMETVEAQNRYFGSLIPGNGHWAEGFVLFRCVSH